MKKIILSVFSLVIIVLMRGQNNAQPEQKQQQLSQKEIDRRIKEKEEKTKNYLKGHTNHFGLFSSPEQDCNGAIAVCQSTYSQGTSYSGYGSTQEVPNSSCLGSQETNSVWYIFTVSNPGSLVFQITPNNSSNDYDFALYNITNNNCSGIPNGTAPEVSCNYSGTPGNTGLSSGGTSNSQGSSGTNQNKPLTVSVGQTYALIVDNYSSTQNGYTLSFAGSTASVFDNVPPSPQSVSMVCGTNDLTLQMSEAVTCASIAAGTYSISGPGGPFTVNSAAGVNCGIFSSQIAINFSPALIQAQTYTITVGGMADNCGNTAASAQLIVVAEPIPVTVKHDSICPNDSKTFTSSVTGATHQWYSPAGVLIAGQTSSSYSVSPAITGVYVDTVISSLGCVSVFRDSVTAMNFSSAVTSKINNPCYHDSVAAISVTSAGGITAYTYNWTGPGGFTGTGTTQSNLTSGTYTIISHSGNCKDSVTATITEPPLPNDTLIINTTFCDGDTSAVLVAPPGFTNYQWYYNGIAITGETDTSIFILNPTSTYNHYSVTYIVMPCKRKTTASFHSIPEALFKPEITTNIFTPNGDGKNDLFHPFYNPLVTQHYIDYASDKYNIKIFDRWGLLVFESDNYASQWNGKTKSGKECGEGTYYWISTYSSRCGKGEVTTKTGFVQLQR